MSKLMNLGFIVGCISVLSVAAAITTAVSAQTKAGRSEAAGSSCHGRGTSEAIVASYRYRQERQDLEARVDEVYGSGV
jgi:cytochrome c553